MPSLITSNQRRRPLVTDLLLPELDRQLGQDPSLWPNIKGLFVIQVMKRRTPAKKWYGIDVISMEGYACRY